MRIVIILDSLRSGGAEILAVRLAEKFCQAGHDIFFIGLHDTGEISHRIKEIGARQYCVNAKKGVKLCTMLKIHQLLRRIQPKITLTNHFRPLLHTWLAAVIQGCNIYHIEHDNLHYKTDNKYIKILRFLLIKTKKLIVISPTLYSYFTKEIPSCKKKCISIVNGVDTNYFSPGISPKQKSTKPSRKGPVFGTCARFVPIKRLNLMLDIFHAYRKKNHCGQLLLVGDGICRASLEKKVQEYNLENAVTFTGYQKDCAPWYKKMDIYLLTSDDEGLPLSILEAMASGVVVVSRDVGDIKRVIEECDGRIVKGINPADWLKTLEELAQDSDKYTQLADNARNKVKQHYSFEKCVQQYLELFSA